MVDANSELVFVRSIHWTSDAAKEAKGVHVDFRRATLHICHSLVLMPSGGIKSVRRKNDVDCRRQSFHDLDFFGKRDPALPWTITTNTSLGERLPCNAMPRSFHGVNFAALLGRDCASLQRATC